MVGEELAKFVLVRRLHKCTSGVPPSDSLFPEFSHAHGAEDWSSATGPPRVILGQAPVDQALLAKPDNIVPWHEQRCGNHVVVTTMFAMVGCVASPERHAFPIIDKMHPAISIGWTPAA